MNAHVDLQHLLPARRFVAPPPLLGFHEYDVKEHRISHMHDLSPGILRELEARMVKNDLAPRMIGRPYYGVLVMVDRPHLQADQPLYRPAYTGQWVMGVVSVGIGSRQVVLAVYDDETVFLRVAQAIHNHPGSRYDRLRVTHN